MDGVSRGKPFLAKLDPSGTVLYSTFQPVAPSEWSSPNAFAVDATGNVYLAGAEPAQAVAPANSDIYRDIPNLRVVKIAPESTGTENRFFLYQPFSPVDGTTSGVDLVVGRTGDATGPAAAAYATSDGTAIAGEDYVAAAGMLSFTSGEVVKTLRVGLIPVPADVVKGDFTFDVTVTPGEPGVNRTTVDICNPKAPPPIPVPIVTTPGTHWTATSDTPWVRVLPPSGTGSGTAAIVVDPTFVLSGVYQTQITWTAQDGGGPVGSGYTTTVTTTVGSYP
jgi:hypothetical protein